MAKIAFSTGYWELTPIKFVDSNDQAWIPFNLSFHFSVGINSVTIENVESEIRKLDIRLMINTFNNCIEQLINTNNEDFWLYSENIGSFTPLEGQFSFSILDGDVMSWDDGNISIRIMLNQNLMASKHGQGYFGIETSIDTIELKKFINTLETEFNLS